MFISLITTETLFSTKFQPKRRVIKGQELQMITEMKNLKEKTFTVITAPHKGIEFNVNMQRGFSLPMRLIILNSDVEMKQEQSNFRYSSRTFAVTGADTASGIAKL